MPVKRKSAGKSVFVLAAACLACLLGCEGRPADDPPQQQPSHSAFGKPNANVLFVSVDTTRADHFACYGHPEAKTPNIDRLAAEGVRFAMCISAIPLTLPSHSTMLTGSYPFVHGARDNAIYQLSEDNVTLPEILGAQGYTTHAEVAAEVLDSKYGMNQGFQTYGDVETRLAERVSVRAEALALDQEPALSTVDLEDPDAQIERPAADITNYGIQAIKDGVAAGKPFFIFLHYFDPHWPFKAPEPFASENEDEYLAEIAYFDAEFGRLIDFLRTTSAADNTLVILTSDHGEGRGQHGEYTHSSFLFDTTLHVPLIIWAPKLLPSGQVVDMQVRTADLAPTVLDFLKQPRTPQMQGESLLPLLARGAHERREAYAETMAAQNMSGYAMIRALRRDEWKYIHAPNPLLYHVAEDAMELFNLAEAESERMSGMRSALRDLIAAAPPPPGGRASRFAAGEESLRALEALGYVTSTVAPEDDPMVQGTELDHFNPVGPDPHEHAEEIDCLSVGLGAYRQGEYEQAELYLGRLLELQPDNHMGLSGMGSIRLSQGRPNEAIDLLLRAIESTPRAEYYGRLGAAYAAAGKAKQAEEAYLECIRRDPVDYRAHFLLGGLYASQRRFDEAMLEYRAAEELAEDKARIRVAIARLHGSKGDVEQAEDMFSSLLADNPTLSEARIHFAALKRHQGDADACLALLEEGVERQPEEAGLRHALAVQYLREGRDQDALSQFRITTDLLNDNPQAYANVGTLLLKLEQTDDAIAAFEHAVALQEDYAPALRKLADAYFVAERHDKAALTYDRLAAVNPENPVLCLLAANAHHLAGDPVAAIASLRAGRAAGLDDPRIANDLAWRLAASQSDELRNGREALELAIEAVEATGREGYNELDTLAVAYAENEQFDKAIEMAERAEEIARTADPEAADRIQARLELYKQGRKYRNP